MTKKEAIERLTYIKTHDTDPEDYELFDFAIKAIEESEVYMNGKDYDLYLEGYKQGKKDFERPQGEWEYNQYDANPNIGNWHCSECRHIIFGGYNQKPYYKFCPMCGADMTQGVRE